MEVRVIQDGKKASPTDKGSECFCHTENHHWQEILYEYSENQGHMNLEEVMKRSHLSVFQSSPANRSCKPFRPQKCHLQYLIIKITVCPVVSHSSYKMKPVSSGSTLSFVNTHLGVSFHGPLWRKQVSSLLVFCLTSSSAWLLQAWLLQFVISDLDI